MEWVGGMGWDWWVGDTISENDPPPMGREISIFSEAWQRKHCSALLVLLKIVYKNDKKTSKSTKLPQKILYRCENSAKAGAQGFDFSWSGSNRVPTFLSFANHDHYALDAPRQRGVAHRLPGSRRYHRRQPRRLHPGQELADALGLAPE